MAYIKLSEFTVESVEQYKASIRAIDKQYNQILAEAKAHYLRLKEDLYKGAQDAKAQAKMELVRKEKSNEEVSA